MFIFGGVILHSNLDFPKTFWAFLKHRRVWLFLPSSSRPKNRLRFVSSPINIRNEPKQQFMKSWESKGPTPPMPRFPQEIDGILKGLLTIHYHSFFFGTFHEHLWTVQEISNRTLNERTPEKTLVSNSSFRGPLVRCHSIFDGANCTLQLPRVWHRFNLDIRQQPSNPDLNRRDASANSAWRERSGTQKKNAINESFFPQVKTSIIKILQKNTPNWENWFQ